MMLAAVIVSIVGYLMHSELLKEEDRTTHSKIDCKIECIKELKISHSIKQLVDYYFKKSQETEQQSQTTT
jgi:hypothetical protein